MCLSGHKHPAPESDSEILRRIGFGRRGSDSEILRRIGFVRRGRPNTPIIRGLSLDRDGPTADWSADQLGNPMSGSESGFPSRNSDDSISALLLARPGRAARYWSELTIITP